MDSNQLINLAIPFFFLAIGIEVFLAWRAGRSVIRFVDAITDLGCGIGQQVIGAFFNAGLALLYAALYERRLVDLGGASLTAWIVAILGVDFAYYWWHRLSHEVNVLWAVHVVHHQSEDYNLAVALRQAWFTLFTTFPFYAPLALLGVPPTVFVIQLSISTLYQFWIHTRLIDRMGAFEWAFNTPSHHRVHHGRNPEYIDRNHAAIFMFWDRLFGTFQVELQEPVYGTVKPYTSWNPLWANFEYFVHLGRLSQGAQSWTEVLRIWLGPPGTVPAGTPVEPLGQDLDRPVRHDATVPPAVMTYVSCHFVLTTLTAIALLVGAMTQPFLTVSLPLGLAVLAAIAVFGGLFEGRSWAVPLELVRLACTLGAAFATGGFGAGAAGLSATTVVVGASLVGLAKVSGATRPESRLVAE